MTKEAARQKAVDNKQAIVSGFQKLQEEKGDIFIDLCKVDEDFREHKRVLEVLNTFDVSRKCYRMVGGTLVEYKIKDVVPLLNTNMQNLEKVSKSLKEQLEVKDKELDVYSEKHNIKLVSEADVLEMQSMNKAKGQK